MCTLRVRRQASHRHLFYQSTVTDPAALRAELASCRERGHLSDLGEQEAGVRCVAAPVCGPDGPHGAVAVSVSGPQGRLDDAAATRAGPLVVAAAARLRAVLGGDR